MEYEENILEYEEYYFSEYEEEASECEEDVLEYEEYYFSEYEEDVLEYEEDVLEYENSFSEALPWQKAFEAILLEYLEIFEASGDVDYAFYYQGGIRGNMNDYWGSSFAIYDINLDGTPELIIRNLAWYHPAYLAIYTFLDEELVQLELEPFGLFNPSQNFIDSNILFFSRIDDEPGINATSLWGGGTWHIVSLVMENNIIRPRIVMESWEDWSYPQGFNQRWTIETESKERTEIGQEKWAEKLEYIFGHFSHSRSEWDFVRIYQISRENIRNVIFENSTIRRYPSN